MFIKSVLALAVTLAYVSTTLCSYQNNGNSPIQIISILPANNGRMLTTRRDGRFNKNLNNNIQRERDDSASPITKIKQIRRKSKSTKHERQFQLGLENGHGLPLHIAPGAYPVYYAIARANGLFKEDKIRSFKLKKV